MQKSTKNEKLKVLQDKLEAFERSVYHKEQYSDGPRKRLKLEIELVKLGVEYVSAQNGIFVGDYILAIHKNKWRNFARGKGKWYWYKTLPDLFDKIGIKYEKAN